MRLRPCTANQDIDYWGGTSTLLYSCVCSVTRPTLVLIWTRQNLTKNIVYSWAEPFGPFLWVIGGQFDIINFGWNRCILTDLWLLNNRQICLVLATSHGPAPRFSRLCSLTAATVCHLTPGRWWSALSLLLLTGHPTLKVSIRHFMKQNVWIATSPCWKLLLSLSHSIINA